MSGFQSLFKINGIPILPPIVNSEEIKLIREQVREKEAKLKKERENIATKVGTPVNRRGSYTLTSPIFTSSELRKISNETSDSDKDTVVDGLLSATPKFDSSATEKSSKDLKNEIDRSQHQHRQTAPPPPDCRPVSAPAIYHSTVAPEVNNKLKDLIEKQKQEYLRAMNALKNKFTTEQDDLLMNLQSIPYTSTPLNNSTWTDDDDFTEFKTCLQSQSIEEKTVVNDHDAKTNASTIINAYARGFLTRRLMKTKLVQENIRNIKETLYQVINLENREFGGSPVQNILLKTKLFRQLQSDMYNFNGIFFLKSIKEKMNMIAEDREICKKKQAEDNVKHLSLSFTEFV